MKINKRYTVIIVPYFYTLSTVLLLSASQEEQKTVIIAVPAILGNEIKGYSDNILSLLSDSYEHHKMGTLGISEFPDFGQERCVNHLDAKITQHKNNDLIFVATSQGTGTTSRYITQCRDIKNNTRAIIYEGYAASFNQCIAHVVESYIPLTRFLPFKDYWLPCITPYLPYFKNTFFPLRHYNPAEQQPFEYLKNIPKDIPIIIVHCKQDRITPYLGAEIAYYTLVSSRHKNTYLMTVEKNQTKQNNSINDGHINILEGNDKQLQDLKHILESLLTNKKIIIDTSEYQPNPEVLKLKAQHLQNKEYRIKKLNSLFTIARYCLLLYMAWKSKSYLVKKLNTKKGTFLQIPS